MIIINKLIPNEYKNISNSELSNIIDSKVKRGILKNNNKKLGKAVYDFNLPLCSNTNRPACTLPSFASLIIASSTSGSLDPNLIIYLS